MTLQNLRINADRLLNDLDDLNKIGVTPEGGISRIAMSNADLEGREWFRQRVKAPGLELREDGAGNMSAILPGADPDAQTILFGSHLDSVPNGGRFDGPLGTLAALEALRTIKEAGITPNHHLEAINFTDEEGGVYSMIGSKALTGQLNMEKLTNLPNQSALEAGLENLGLSKESVLSAKRDTSKIKAFFEIHIEQGTRLVDANKDIGVVTSLVGIRMFTLNFQGKAAHAGTMPMEKRKDALWGASEFLLKGKNLVMERFTPGVMNCGQVTIPNSASNIVPENVTISLEFRHGTTKDLDKMEKALLVLANQIATENHLKISIEPRSHVIPALTNDGLVQLAEQTADALGLSHMRLLSFAGHDTQTMSQRVPAVMLFIPSVNGISHAPDEFSKPEDIVNGANMLLQMVVRTMD